MKKKIEKQGQSSIMPKEVVTWSDIGRAVLDWTGEKAAEANDWIKARKGALLVTGVGMSLATVTMGAAVKDPVTLGEVATRTVDWAMSNAWWFIPTMAGVDATVDTVATAIMINKQNAAAREKFPDKQFRDVDLRTFGALFVQKFAGEASEQVVALLAGSALVHLKVGLAMEVIGGACASIYGLYAMIPDVLAKPVSEKIVGLALNLVGAIDQRAAGSKAL